MNAEQTLIKLLRKLNWLEYNHNVKSKLDIGMDRTYELTYTTIVKDVPKTHTLNVDTLRELLMFVKGFEKALLHDNDVYMK